MLPEPDIPRFTREEVRQALAVMLAPEEVAEAMEFIYTEAGGFENVGYSSELLDALSSLSEDAAARVRRMRSYERDADCDG